MLFDVAISDEDNVRAIDFVRRLTLLEVRIFFAFIQIILTRVVLTLFRVKCTHKLVD